VARMICLKKGAVDSESCGSTRRLTKRGAAMNISVR